mmetsp:Transcript_18459/g.37829  ORF Transcript_18459/g.37829 Transcript_18459/m.37829 type:complete len:563 (-) Transcript_18459:158-1846(-)
MTMITTPAGKAVNNGNSPATKSRSAGFRYLTHIQLILFFVQLCLPFFYFNYPSNNITSNGGSAIAGQIGHDPPAVAPLPDKSDVDQESSQKLRRVTENKAQSSSPVKSKSNVRVVGTFNNVPISYVPPSSTDGGLHSTAHCIGEHFHDRAWLHRSCEYRNICFDTEEKDFVLFRSPMEVSLAEAMNKHKMVQNGLLTVSSALNTSVSLGGINAFWGSDQSALEWAPIIRNEELTEGYYLLPQGTVLLPFHSFAAMNIGHLFWDDLLPIYSLIDMFEMIPDMTTLMPLRYTLKHRERALWATCDLRDQTLRECKQQFKKVLPLIGVDPKIMRSTEDSILNITDNSEASKSRYICSSKGAAGMGVLNDHGFKTHGWNKGDYEYSYNAGRGSVFNRFRNFLMKNIGMDPIRLVSSEPPYIITFSPSNSRDPDRRIRYNKQTTALEKAFKDEISRGDVVVRSVQFNAIPIEEQVKKVAESAIIVGTCGGGASTNMFLPKGAGMILYYPDKPSGRGHNYPARLDWDYFNNAGYARVHWLPISEKDSEEDVDLFVKLVKNEIETISHH